MISLKKVLAPSIQAPPHDLVGVIEMWSSANDYLVRLTIWTGSRAERCFGSAGPELCCFSGWESINFDNFLA